jgi:hypothetical protein
VYELLFVTILPGGKNTSSLDAALVETTNNTVLLFKVELQNVTTAVGTRTSIIFSYLVFGQESGSFKSETASGLRGRAGRIDAKVD